MFNKFSFLIKEPILEKRFEFPNHLNEKGMCYLKLIPKDNKIIAFCIELENYKGTRADQARENVLQSIVKYINEKNIVGNNKSILNIFGIKPSLKKKLNFIYEKIEIYFISHIGNNKTIYKANIEKGINQKLDIKIVTEQQLLQKYPDINLDYDKKDLILPLARKSNKEDYNFILGKINQLKFDRIHLDKNIYLWHWGRIKFSHIIMNSIDTGRVTWFAINESKSNDYRNWEGKNNEIYKNHLIINENLTIIRFNIKYQEFINSISNNILNEYVHSGLNRAFKGFCDDEEVDGICFVDKEKDEIALTPNAFNKLKPICSINRNEVIEVIN